KISLSLASSEPPAPKADRGDGSDSAGDDGSDDGAAGGRTELNFSESFDAELADTYGDLGPAPVCGGGRGGRGGGRRR
ncbi:MAG: hypothetical protein ACKOYM_04235, partial [Actinomycetes bacterium]